MWAGPKKRAIFVYSLEYCESHQLSNYASKNKQHFVPVFLVRLLMHLKEIETCWNPLDASIATSRTKKQHKPSIKWWIKMTYLFFTPLSKTKHHLLTLPPGNSWQSTQLGPELSHFGKTLWVTNLGFNTNQLWYCNWQLLVSTCTFSSQMLLI